MTDTLTLTLPLPPSTNHAYGKRKPGARSKTGKYLPPMFKTAAGTNFQRTAWALTVQARGLQRWYYEEFGRVAVSIRFYMPDKRRRDVDGPVKLLLDAVSQALGFDDSVVKEMHIAKDYDKANPRAEVTVRMIERGE